MPWNDSRGHGQCIASCLRSCFIPAVVSSQLVDLHRRGFHIVIADDAVCSRRTRHKKNVLMQLCEEGVLIVYTETILFSLAEKGGTDLFRKVSALVK